MPKIIYYDDELADDFATTVEKDKLKPLPENYEYISKNPLSRALSRGLLRFAVKHFSRLYLKLFFRHKFVNGDILKGLEGGGFFYCNHTLIAGDAFIPNCAHRKKPNYIVTGEQTSSLTRLLPLLRAIGNIPLAQGGGQKMKMNRCVQKAIARGATVTIYPEAHSWPYYTGIRPFSCSSFKYAAYYGAPVYALTNCFVRRKRGKKPAVVTYIDGPFYPQAGLSVKENAVNLRNAVYNAMRLRAGRFSTYSYYKYVKRQGGEQG